MIIANGTIEWRQPASGGLDPVSGFPVATGTQWGDPLPAQIVPVSVNLLAAGSASGERYVSRSFTVLTESPRPSGASYLRLRLLSGETVGEFALKSAEPLEAVGQWKLTV